MSGSNHPLARFLAARLACIRWLRSEGRSMDQIAEVLSIDTPQVAAILQATDPKEPR